MTVIDSDEYQEYSIFSLLMGGRLLSDSSWVMYCSSSSKTNPSMRRSRVLASITRASSKPNLLNVAVMGAKNRAFLVGSKDLWDAGTYGYQNQLY